MRIADLQNDDDRAKAQDTYNDIVNGFMKHRFTCPHAKRELESDIAEGYVYKAPEGEEYAV